MKTKFASPERAPEDIIEQQAEIFQDNEILNNFLSKIPAVFLIVNNYRQIVYMNRGALDFGGIEDLASVIGLRPGEIFGCIHSQDEEGGCGTSIHCTYCGAIKAVLISQKGKPAVEEAHLILGPEEKAYDLRVWASPLTLNGREFHAVTIQDISDQKRKIILERVFFHDILNNLTGLLGIVDLLMNYKDKLNQEEYLEKTKKHLDVLVDEIRFQQMLHHMENDTLSIEPQNFNTLELCNELLDMYENLAEERNIKIQLDEELEDVTIKSDKIILRRIIGNMLKNAIEASEKNDTVTLGSKKINNKIEFWVHNPGFIPENIQLQIFNRSFSTKGANRGLGTYSMKLLSSDLKGEVDFTSSRSEGTVFRALYPINILTED